MHPRFGDFAEGLVAVPDMVYFAGLGAVSFGLAWLSLDLERVR
jgi:hypothetical protein